jgi:O-Antigen ligase
MTAFSRTSHGLPFGRLLSIRRRHLDLAGLELPVTRLAIFFSVFPSLRLPNLFFTLSDLIFCLSAAMLLLSGRLRFAPMGPLTVPWMCAFALFGGGMIVSSLLGAEPERVLIVVGQYAFAYVVLAYIIVRTDETITDAFIKSFVLGTVCVNAYGLVMLFTGADDQFQLVTGSGRLASFMSNPNANANIIGLTLPFVLYLWFARKWRLAYVVGSLSILAYSLVATSSVGGLLWSLTGVAVFIALTMSWRVLVGLLVCLAVVIPLLGNYASSILPEAFQTRVLGAAESGDIEEAGTFSYRMQLIHQALDVVGDQLLVGLGADQYRLHNGSDVPVHDVYLLLWAEGGLPALIGWLMLPQIIVLCALWVFGRPGGRLIAATVLAVALVFLLAATGSAHMYGRFWVVPLHLATALLMISWSGLRQPGPAGPTRQRGPRVVARRLRPAGDAAPIPREPRRPGAAGTSAPHASP